MLVPDALLSAHSLPLAYIGLGPGQELIPYFWALLALAAAAFGAIIQWPITALRRAFAKKASPQSAVHVQSGSPNQPEMPGNGIPAEA